MTRTLKLAAILAAVVMTALTIAVPKASAADVTGEWAITVDTPNGKGMPTAILKQDGETLTGTYKGRFGEAPIKGTIKGNDIKFSATISVQGNDLTLEYTGTVDGNSMKGKAKFGEAGEGDFTATKK